MGRTFPNPLLNQQTYPNNQTALVSFLVVLVVLVYLVVQSSTWWFERTPMVRSRSRDARGRTSHASRGDARRAPEVRSAFSAAARGGADLAIAPRLGLVRGAGVVRVGTRGTRSRSLPQVFLCWACRCLSCFGMQGAGGREGGALPKLTGRTNTSKLG